MSSLNQNYVTGLAGFASDKGTPQAYQASAAGQFNQLSAGLSFAAYVLFWIDGGVQQVSALFETRQFLWGNLDDANTNGWGIYLEPDGSTQMVLTAGMYGAGGLRTSEVILSNAESGSFVERLICAALWWDGENLSLTVNGSLQPPSVAIAEAYQPSALRATLGCDEGGNAPAGDCRIVSAGYAPVVVTGATVGALAGAHFRACRESDGGGYLDAVVGRDWAHRYEASAVVPDGTAGTITKTASGPAQASAPVAPTSLPDEGNLGPVAFTGTSPSALGRLGVTNLTLQQVAQPDWYDAPAFEFSTLP